MAELDQSTSTDESTAKKENEAKLKRLRDEVDDLHKSIQDMSRKKLEEASEN